MASATKLELYDMIQNDIKKLQGLREQLFCEMERASQDLVSTRYWNSEIVIDKIKDSKNNYQDEVEDFVDRYTEVVENQNFLMNGPRR